MVGLGRVDSGSYLPWRDVPLDPGHEREPLPEEPGGTERVLRLVGDAFDRRIRAA